MDLEATGQLVITTRCQDSPTGEHVWVSGDEHHSDFCKYCGGLKFLGRLDVLAAKTIKNRDKRIQQCKDASTSLRPRGIIFKRCPNCNSRLKFEKDVIIWSQNLSCYYYTCLNCGYAHGRLTEK